MEVQQASEKPKKYVKQPVDSLGVIPSRKPEEEKKRKMLRG